MAIAYIALGTNLGDKEANIKFAVNNIETRLCGTATQSRLFYSEPWGYQSINGYVNAVIAISTALSPDELYAILHDIESEMGSETHRNANGDYADRIIDLDILMYDNEEYIYSSPLVTLPHPRMHQRPFVMIPLREVQENIL